MEFTIPASTPYSIQRKDKGIAVWAVQSALNDVGFSLVEDGAFGKLTEGAAEDYQDAAGLKPDGVVGPNTQAALADSLAHGLVVPGDLPDGLIKGIVEGESGNKIAAVNHSVPGGVDCGYCQRRVYDTDRSQAAIKHAFDGRYQMQLLATALLGRHNGYFGEPGAQTHERAWRLATLYHNYPVAADKIARVGEEGLSAYWTSPQAWVTNVGAKFPDEAPVRTPLEWCQHYALGSPEHDDPGTMVRYAFPL